ncbi:MAG: glutamate-5-semialdehyde dehydrogenase [Clostridiales bacterium]|nr:glutamate-5-semialdehyde dehydrogenase [Clostridiales bacterium]
MDYINALGKNAKLAEAVLAGASAEAKNAALSAVAAALRENSRLILSENAKDLENGRNAGLSEALLDRLALNDERINGMAQGVCELVSAPDPIGRISEGSVRPNGLRISKITVPLGVIAVIYEARPNVTADAASLCLKAGNAAILRGGKEAINSNKAIADIMRSAIAGAGLPADCVQLVGDTSRESATALMQLNEYIDLLIPRGGAGLIRSVIENSTVPVIETGVGNCHIYVDASAELDMAASIVFNAKTSRPSVCNACEKVLLHKDIAAAAFEKIKALLDTKNVKILGDEAVCAMNGAVSPASDDDWAREFLDYIIGIKVVNDIDEAIAHIAEYGTKHSEAIVTSDYSASEKFLAQVDAAAVYVNASTRFTDGGEFGYGAEIGISTQKLHARGPLGLSQLTSFKYVVRGDGQIR